jgi:hypothetical protein
VVRLIRGQGTGCTLAGQAPSPLQDFASERADRRQCDEGYERQDFREAWDTYLQANSAATALQTAPVAGISGAGDPLQVRCVADGESEK